MTLNIIIKIFLYHGDLTDSLSISLLLNSIKPHEIYNLGAQSHVQILLKHQNIPL